MHFALRLGACDIQCGFDFLIDALVLRLPVNDSKCFARLLAHGRAPFNGEL